MRDFNAAITKWLCAPGL